MAATVWIEKYNIEATIDKYKWYCEDKTIEKALTELTVDPLGSWGDDPDPDHSAAMQAIEILGGRIIKFDKVPYDPEVIY